MTEDDAEHAAMLARVKAEVADSFDEELELEGVGAGDGHAVSARRAMMRAAMERRR